MSAQIHVDEPSKFNPNSTNSSKNKNKNELGQHIKEYADNTTMHGCNELTQGNLVKRLIWAIVIIGMAGAAGYYIYFRVSDYTKFDVSVSFQKKYSSRFQHNLTLPTITICNYNRFYFNEFKMIEDQTILIDNFHTQFGLGSANNSSSLDLHVLVDGLSNFDDTEHSNFINTVLNSNEVKTYINLEKSVHEPSMGATNWQYTETTFKSRLVDELRKIYIYQYRIKNKMDQLNYIETAKYLMDLMSPYNSKQLESVESEFALAYDYADNYDASSQ